MCLKINSNFKIQDVIASLLNSISRLTAIRVYIALANSAIPIPRLEEDSLDYHLHIVYVVYYFLYVPKWQLI